MKSFQEYLEIELAGAQDDLEKTQKLVDRAGHIFSELSIRLMSQKKHLESIKRILDAYKRGG